MIIYGCKKDNSESVQEQINEYNGKSTAVFNNNLTYMNVTDLDGNIYKTIVIGTQTWMAENLRTTRYSNGESLPVVTNDTTWSQLTAGAYCNYENTTNDTAIATYGRLYNWYAVNDSRKIAPKGWHVPTYDEWLVLIHFLGNDTITGGKMKEAGLKHWNSPNTGADNSSGFTSLPGSFRGFYVFYSPGIDANFWSGSEFDADNAYGCDNQFQNRTAYCGFSNKQFGFSIRCVKD